MCALYVHKRLQEDGVEIHIILIFILRVRELFGLSTISLEGLMVNTFRGIRLCIEGRNQAIFDRKRVFETNKQKSVMRNQETVEENRIAERIEDFSQFHSATQPRIQQNEELNQKDSAFSTIEENKKVIFKMTKIKKY